VVPVGPAWAEWDGTTGSVCSRGYAKDGPHIATHVYLNVDPGENVPYPTSPTGSLITPDPVTGLWDTVVSGVIGHPNSDPHTLHCWARWSDGSETRFGRVNFTPFWSVYPYCDYPAHAASRPEAKDEPFQFIFDVIPAAWRVETNGFTGDLIACCNGAWVMHLAPSAEKVVLYCNGGDGKTVPRVQLSCEHPASADWTLDFAIGDCRVSYSLAADLFGLQSANVFQHAHVNGAFETLAIPAAIRIHPC